MAPFVNWVIWVIVVEYSQLWGRCVGAISIHLLVSFILVLLILATWGSIALGVARHGKLGISTGWITQLGKGVDGGEHTVLTVAVKPTSPTASC